MVEILVQHPDIAKENSTRRIMRAIRQLGPITKLELQRQLGLSHPTVQAGVNRLLENGIIYTEQTQGAVRGRKPAALAYCYDARVALGVELRSDVLRLTLCDLKPTVLVQEELPGPGSEAALRTPDFLHLLSGRIDRFLVEHRVPLEKLLPICLSLPGELRCGVWTIARGSLTQDDLQFFFTLPILVSSSRALSGMSELWDLSIPNASVLQLDRELLLYTVRQGYPVTAGYAPLGDGIPPLRGSTRAISHTALYPGGKPCACGRRGCAIQYCGMDALLCGETKEDFFAAVQKGDGTHTARLDEFLDALAQLLCNIDMLFGSDILLTGELSESLVPFLPRLHEKIRACLSPQNTLSGTLSQGRFGRFVNAVAASIYSIAMFIDSDYFAEF